MKQIKIILADDHRLFRDGIRSILSHQKDMTIVAETSDGPTTVEEALKYNPDILLLDISMPLLNGIEVARRIREARPNIKIIMLSMHSDRRFVVESLRIGVAGYILKESASDELLHAIQAAGSGREIFLSQSLQSFVLSDYVKLLSIRNDDSFSLLSSREREVLQCIAEGMTVKEIAVRFHLSFKTIESHKKNIMDKLDLHSIAELTKYAVKEGLTGL